MLQIEETNVCMEDRYTTWFEGIVPIRDMAFNFSIASAIVTE
jgi:hypothetical protein